MESKIPPQKTGGYNDTVSDIFFETEQEAKKHYQTVKARFLDINNWEKWAGDNKAAFTLYDKNGLEISRLPTIGDYFRINIPGPNNPTGEGDDWVQIEDLQVLDTENEESVSMRVRPASAPITEGDETAHFYAEHATSNFVVKRIGIKILAEVHGRNEKPNTEDLGLVEKIRNTVVAIGGILVAGKYQWKALTQGLVKLEESEA